MADTNFLAGSKHIVCLAQNYLFRLVTVTYAKDGVSSILSFLLTVGAWDQAQSWQSLDASQRSSIKAEYAAAGIKLMVSAFGATDAPTSVGLDPVATANTMAAWVKQYGLDGIDVDYEVCFTVAVLHFISSEYFVAIQDFNAINAGDGKAEAWLTSFTKQLRVQLPQGTYILTHAREYHPRSFSW